MTEYEYEAEDSSRQIHSGRISAASANEAVKTLGGQGLRIRRLRPSQGGFTPPGPISPPPARASAAVGLGQGQGSAIGAMMGPSGPLVRTAPTRAKDLYFFFAQLAELIDAGIDPSAAMRSLGGRGSHRGLTRACQEMAPRLVEGRSISSEMERYPDLFPPGAVGAIRSGEEAGNIPEVCRVVAEQTQRAHKLDRGVWWAWVAVWNTVLAFALLYPLIGVVNQGIDVLAEKAGAGSQASDFGLAYLRTLNTPIGWLLFGLVALLWFWGWARRQTFTRSLRHRWGMKAPLFKKRAELENMMLFTWHLSSLSRSGRSPWQAFQLAARAVPNEAFSERLLSQVGSLRDTSQFSAIARQAEMIPVEWRGLIETGEMTGRLPQALEQVSVMARDEASQTEKSAMLRLGCWAFLCVAGGSILAFAMLYGSYLNGAFRILDQP
jgi:type II secretory pathway component PulF